MRVKSLMISNDTSEDVVMIIILVSRVSEDTVLITRIAIGFISEDIRIIIMMNSKISEDILIRIMMIITMTRVLSLDSEDPNEASVSEETTHDGL